MSVFVCPGKNMQGTQYKPINNILAVIIHDKKSVHHQATIFKVQESGKISIQTIMIYKTRFRYAMCKGYFLCFYNFLSTINLSMWGFHHHYVAFVFLYYKCWHLLPFAAYL